MAKKNSLQAINDDSRFNVSGWEEEEVEDEVIEQIEKAESEQNSENEVEDEKDEKEKENDEYEDENEDDVSEDEEAEAENESDKNSDKEKVETDNEEEGEKSVTSKKLKKNQIKDLEAFNQKIAKSGVVYLSRIPPRLKPSKLRSLLEDRGAKIGRIYLAPEDLHSKNRRKATGGGNDRRFTEGWVEFEDKKKAKAYAAFLNTTPMNPKKRSFHHEDLWNLKYLPKFKWHHLTERMDYDKASRNQLLTFEIQQGRKEASNYTDKVELANRIQHFEKKKREQGIESNEEERKKYKREFDQREVQESELSNRQIKKIKHKLRVQGKGSKDSKSNDSKSASGGGMDDVLNRMFT